MRALIIEDDKPLSDALRRMLGSIAETEAVYDGESGLNKILTEEYDIVILDIMLPKMNGEEVLRGARRHKLTPIIILSAIGMLERKVEFLNLGADDYMVKPFSREELLARVQATMRRYHRDFGALRYKLGDLSINFHLKSGNFCAYIIKAKWSSSKKRLCLLTVKCTTYWKRLSRIKKSRLPNSSCLTAYADFTAKLFNR